MNVAIKILPHGADLSLPAYASALAAGCDLMAAIPSDQPLSIAPGARCLVPTGIALGLPATVEAQVRPRSGLALKHGLTVLNAPGTIDADYRGEVLVLLINLGTLTVVIERGMRIAQLVIAPVLRVTFTPVEDLEATTRAAGGFGSTGLGRKPDNGA